MGAERESEGKSGCFRSVRDSEGQLEQLGQLGAVGESEGHGLIKAVKKRQLSSMRDSEGQLGQLGAVRAVGDS